MAYRLSALPSSPFTCGGKKKKETGKNRNRRAYVEVLTPGSDAGTARCAPRGSGFGDISRQTWTLQPPRDDCGKDATSHHHGGDGQPSADVSAIMSGTKSLRACARVCRNM